MNSTDGLMGNAQDHIMANTWRLIFDRTARRPFTSPTSTPNPDFLLLEELLSEYRLIGLSLAEKTKSCRLN